MLFEHNKYIWVLCLLCNRLFRVFRIFKVFDINNIYTNNIVNTNPYTKLKI